MSRQITITLPDVVSINGAKDAPESLRSVSTEKWGNNFIVNAITHGISQKIGDAWSVNGKNPRRGDIVRTLHSTLEAGEWAVRERTGASVQKFDEAIKKLNVIALKEKLTAEQLSALAALINADNANT